MTSTENIYISKAKKLNKEQQERVLSRMDGKLPKRLKKEKITTLEAIALQLELEDEHLLEWREKMAEIREKEDKEKLKTLEKLEKSKEKK